MSPFPAFPLLHRLPTCPAWLSAVSAAARCEPFPAPAATCTRYRRCPARGTSAGAWNIAVRTRGVFTHRDDFQKPACAERGLVRTGTAPITSESAVIWTFRAITPATVGREESPSVSSQQRPICSRLDRTFRRRCRLNSPACCSRQARYYRHFTCRRRLPLAARLTFLGSRDCSTQARPPAVADKTLTDRQIKVLPVRISGQVKPLIYSVPRCYPPPLVCRGARVRGYARHKDTPNDLTKKSASADRPRPGFRTAKSERPLRAQGFGDMPRIKSPHQRTGAVAGLCHGKVGKRLEHRRGPGICPAQGLG